MTPRGTAAYRGERDLPPAVVKAVQLAEHLGFEFSCLPSQGRFLQLLASGVDGGRIAETGTGCGVGLAWLASGAGEATSIVSVEIDAGRAAAVAELFADRANVVVLADRWQAIEGHGPFDLLVLDGGGSGKSAEVDPEAADPARLLRPGGTVVIDDFTPSDTWPPTVGGEVDEARLLWLTHPALAATELRVTPSMSTVVGRRR